MASTLERIVTPLGRLLKNKRAGDENSVRHALELGVQDGGVPDGAARTLQLTSAAFEHNAVMPERQSARGRGDNISPELEWSPVPDATRQLLLIMEDVDVPIKRPGIHMAALFDPSIGHLDEGALTTDNRAIRFIPGFAGRTGYFGPRPIPGHGPHRYHFMLFALDAAIPADVAITKLGDVLPLVAGHVVARGILTGVQIG